MANLIPSLMASLALSASASAPAPTVLITNDDGLTSNVVALYHALKAKGFDVVVSVPCRNQSGTGAAVQIAKPLPPIATNCRAGAATAGDPGAGPMTRAEFSSDFFYVDGTPVMAVLYGLDVVAKQRWHHAPDIVLSGPNEGRNVGRLIISSGTVGAAEFAALRGVPAIAFSAGEATSSGDGVANPASLPIATLATRLVTELDRQAHGRPMLPRSIVLNVNFPDDPAHARWRLTRTGTYEAYTLAFVEGGSSPSSNRSNAPALPGVRVGRNDAKPRPSQMEDEGVIARHDITVSILSVGYGSPRTGSLPSIRVDRLNRLAPAE